MQLKNWTGIIFLHLGKKKKSRVERPENMVGPERLSLSKPPRLPSFYALHSLEADHLL